jgi:glycine cleavage system transcriptional repressor
VPKTVVLTGVGRDRVGIVAAVAEKLYQLGCNLLDSSMTLMRGEFALILMVQLPEAETVESLQKSMVSVEKEMGLTIHLRELSEQEIAEPVTHGNPCLISVYGADRPGIVSGITRAIADLNLNITDVQTKYSDSGGKQIFVMMLEVTAPESMPAQAVESSLSQVASSLEVDVSVQILEVYEL